MPNIALTEIKLPVVEALPALRAALADAGRAVLVAPPGAGKTTLVPLALLDAAWAREGRILVLEPRRIAARAAAARMAALLGEPVGETVGYRVRLDARVGPRTRIEVLTEGLLTRRLQGDPGLEGVAAVLFDEFHERSLQADLGLALTLEAGAALRPDLRLVVMSATVDAAPVAALLGDVPVVESLGRAFPVETRHRPPAQGQRLDGAMAAAVRAALAEETGSILAFLPGEGEIRRTAALLEQGLPADVDLAPLYGALPAEAQDAAIRPARPRRWSAEARLTRTVSSRVMPVPGSNRLVRRQPPSITTRTPSMVRLVSATAVASTTLRRPDGAGRIAASCASAGSAP